MNFLELLEYIILGIIQGFTEPIPVSSSGHVMIFNELLTTNIDVGLLAILTNFGSLIAICYLYRERIITLFKDFFSHLKNKNKKPITIIDMLFILSLLLSLQVLWDLSLQNLEYLLF